MAEHGHRLLPRYDLDVVSGRFTYRGARPPALRRLTDLSYQGGKLQYRVRHATEPESVLPGYLAEARRILTAPPIDLDPRDPVAPPGFELLRWFVLPTEAARELTGGSWGQGAEI